KGTRVILQRTPRFVVITGASTGIGAACAIGCAEEGMTVFAGVRQLKAGAALQAKGGTAIIPLELDVTNGESIKQAAESVTRQVGEAGLSGLVNNAGIAIGSPLEFIPLAQLRRQFEVNVVGQIAVTQALLPLLRRAHGRIVNMGSIAGRGTIPLTGPYSASKHALEALTDALRLELYPWGIEVSIIEPGAVATPIWDTSLRTSMDVESEIPAEGRHLYQAVATSIREAMSQAAARAIPPDAVVKAVLHALTAKRPKTRYLVGRDAKLRAMMLKWLPDRLQDWVLKKVLKLPTTI
ncbi:MAG TPA: SDR family oxidoreductase, partial [Nitrospira sp.]|nr:SDR family oxidoreductase [Nitrospira sp.]